jgi:hypothetical protein
MMGDVAGGFIVGGMEIAGIVLMVMSGIESYVDNGYWAYDYNGSSYWVDNGYYDYTNTWMSIPGLLLEAGGIVYGFIRPFQYDTSLAKKNGTYYASNNPMDHINIAIIPGNKGIHAVNMSYSFQF